MKRRSFIFGAPLVLAACTTPPVKWSSDDLIQRMRYRHDGPPRLTLLTMRNVGTGRGAHTALMINASERVLWDPAGSFGHELIPERHDVVYGITPRIEQYYISYHSRKTFYTDIQEVDVSAEVAEMAFAAARAYGPVPQALCAKSTSTILHGLPGFESIKVTYFPELLEEDFGKIPGVTFRTYHEEDSDDKTVAAAEIDRDIRTHADD